MDRDRLGQIAQVILTECVDGRAVGRRAEGAPCFVGEQHLATVSGRHDAGGTVHGRSEVVAVSFERTADVQAHAHSWGEAARPLLGGQTSLGGQHAADRVVDAGEGGAERVAGDGEHAAAMVFDGPAHGGVVAGDDVIHRHRLSLPCLHAALQVGEQERDVAARAHAGVIAQGRPSGRSVVVDRSCGSHVDRPHPYAHPAARR